MELIVVGSSSAGNCYALRASDGQILVIEAGRPLKMLQKCIDYKVGDVYGVLVTHEHGDHASRIGEYMGAMFAPIIMSKGTLEALKEAHPKWISTERPIGGIATISHGEVMKIGRFAVMALSLENSKGEPTHDAAEPMCYMIEHPEVGKLLFVTDTYMMPYRPKGVNTVMIECNYAADVLEENCMKGIIDPKRKRRTVLSHMSLDNCKYTLQSMDLKECRRIVLLHMSGDNGVEERFVREVSEATGKHVIMAAEGLAIDIDKEVI